MPSHLVALIWTEKQRRGVMELRWTAAAADDLEHIADYLFEKTPENAEILIRRIFDAPSLLKTSNRDRVN